MEKLMSVVGIIVILGISYLISTNKKAINWKLVLIGLGALSLFAVIIIPNSIFNVWLLKLTGLKQSPGGWFFGLINDFFITIIGFSDQAMTFLLGSNPAAERSLFNNVIFRALPLIIFFSALMAVLYHLGIMQKIIRFFSVIIGKLFRTSGAETLAIVSNVFVGMIEALLSIRPFLSKLTRSELFAVVVSGMATIAGSVFAVYVGMLQGSIPGVAGHLLTASIMSAPAAIVIAKIMIPEDQSPITLGKYNVNIPKQTVNVIDAAATGAKDGLKLAFNVGAILLVFVGLIYLINYLFTMPQPWFGIKKPLTIQGLAGHLFAPITFILGIPWQDSLKAGILLGEKVILNEWIAYDHLAKYLKAGAITQRSGLILSYALCGFANFGSIGIMIGGFSAIAPDKGQELAKLGLKAMLAGLFAGFLTACVAGIIV